MRSSIYALFALLLQSITTNAVNPTWVSLDMTTQIEDYTYTGTSPFTGSLVPVQFGDPPQEILLTIDLSTDWLSAWSYDCVLCPGDSGSFFKPSLSDSFVNQNATWPPNSQVPYGSYANDTLSFGGLIKALNTQFVLTEANVTDVPYVVQNGNFGNLGVHIIQNGNLGLYVNASNPTASILSQLYSKNWLLNPVVGLSFSHPNPHMTIGALDPADYEGELNWVVMETPPADLKFSNGLKIDGIKGYNGSFLPFGDNLIADLQTMSSRITVPSSSSYFSLPGYRGPNKVILPDMFYPGVSYACGPPANDTIYLTVTINGIDYEIDSEDMLIPPYFSDSAPWGESYYCLVLLGNTTTGSKPDVNLGLPFLRNVYIAYRFPTDSCPGYYGFAFPKGLNRTQSQLAQQPTSTPTLSAQCLSLMTPSSTPTPTPTPTAVPAVQATKEGAYTVFGRPQDGQVPLVGARGLGKMAYKM